MADEKKPTYPGCGDIVVIIVSAFMVGLTAGALLEEH